MKWESTPEGIYHQLKKDGVLVATLLQRTVGRKISWKATLVSKAVAVSRVFEVDYEKTSIKDAIELVLNEAKAWVETQV
jgi:hypothetical protein